MIMILILNNNLPVVQVEIVNGKPAVTSLQIAEVFGKEHQNVLVDIRNILESDDFSQRNFAPTSYVDSFNRKQSMFTLSRDGFLMVALAYTGYKARALRKAYIIKFSEMEATLASQTPALPTDYATALRDIESILPQVSENFGKLNFQLSEYTTTNNLGFKVRKPMYLLTKDGFSMLAMGYNGPKAFALKEHILAKLNAYESGQLPALPADYATALRALADTVEQKALVETKLALAAPKAEVYDNVVANKNMTIARFARTLRGVNTNNTKGDLCVLKYLYKMSGVYRVYAKFRDTYFTEKVNGYTGRVDILVLSQGKQELVKLYHDGKLTMKVGEKPCARRSA